MSTKHGKTLRLHMPQWQGGNMHDYYFGSRLLVWLAPPPDGPVETVPVPEPKSGKTLKLENGILGRGALIRQARAAREAIEIHRPDRIVTLGGDCLIDLAPIAYLNTRYGGNLGVLWVDAHPNVLTPKNFAQGNAQVLGALLGKRGFRSGRRGQNACKKPRTSCMRGLTPGCRLRERSSMLSDFAAPGPIRWQKHLLRCSIGSHRKASPISRFISMLMCSIRRNLAL
jgi:arginase family enzyme